MQLSLNNISQDAVSASDAARAVSSAALWIEAKSASLPVH